MSRFLGLSGTYVDPQDILASVTSKSFTDPDSIRILIKFFLSVTIVIIPDVLVTNPITRLY